MIALHVRLLTDRFQATAFNDRASPEWPPHPARLFAALVDTLWDVDDVDPDEAQALDLVAAWGPPIIAAGDAAPRRIMTHFVPVNDVSVINLPARQLAKVEEARAAVAEAADAKAVNKAEKALEKATSKLADDLRKAAAAAAGPVDSATKTLPWSRTRQPRTFPAVVPEQPVVSYLWDAALTEAQAHALGRLCGRLVRLGHSSTLVSCGVNVEAAAPDDGRTLYRPDDGGDIVLRVPRPGHRAALEDAFTRHQGSVSGRVLPAAFQTYSAGEPPADALPTAYTAGRWVAYELLDGGRPSASAAAALGLAVRDAVLAHAGDDIPACLHGHGDDGPLRAPHLMVIPLPFVRHPQADGMVRGFAVCLPAGADDDDERALLRALRRWELADPDGAVDVYWSERGRYRARRVVDEGESLFTIRRGRWARPSCTWASVTPIALSGHDDRRADPTPAQAERRRRKLRRLVAKEVLHALGPAAEGLSVDDVGVELLKDPPVPGAPALREVAPYRRGGHARATLLVHAVIELPVAVCGPLVVGAGRHVGLGLCIPVAATPRAAQEAS